MESLKNLKKVQGAALSCVSCGQCRNPIWPSKNIIGVCPVYNTEYTPKFEPYFSRGKNTILKGLLWGELNLSQDLANIFFQCTTCGACEEFCHNSYNQNIDFPTHRWMENVKVYESLRADLVEAGFALEEHKEMNKALQKLKNPYNREPHAKLEWTKDLDFKIKDASKEPVEYLYYVGCTSALSLKTQNIAKATAQVLQKLEIDFGILGENEICCGSVAKRTGDLKVFNQVKQENIEQFKRLGIKKIITSCAGCYRTFLKDYHKDLSDIKIYHSSEIISDYIKNKKLPQKKLNLKTTYHDPCHLGRHCNFYEPPRNVLNAISDFKEMKRSRENALCCGAGGGVKKAFPELALEMANNRIYEAKEMEIDVLVSTCPFCHRNLNDSIDHLGINLKMIDLTELFLNILTENSYN
ncbi:MAG: (Fe-S)-binding protein [Candidatus Helarchaeota archaeon]